MEDELERMKKCDHHVFAMIRNTSKDNKPDVVIECVKCGLTNKNEELDAFLAACFGVPIKRGTTNEFHRVVKLDTMEDLKKLDLLTDEAIADYSRSDGKDRVLYDHGDLNLRYNDVHPIPGGVYDLDTFGSPIEDRCICGKVRQPSNEPCPNCGARMTESEDKE